MPTLGSAGTRCLIIFIREGVFLAGTALVRALKEQPWKAWRINPKQNEQEAGAVCHTLARPECHREESSAHEEDAREEARGVALRLGSVGLR